MDTPANTPETDGPDMSVLTPDIREQALAMLTTLHNAFAAFLEGFTKPLILQLQSSPDAQVPALHLMMAQTFVQTCGPAMANLDIIRLLVEQSGGKIKRFEELVIRHRAASRASLVGPDGRPVNSGGGGLIVPGK